MFFEERLTFRPNPKYQNSGAYETTAPYGGPLMVHIIRRNFGCRYFLNRFLWILRFCSCLVEKLQMSHLNNSSVLSISEITLFRARTSTLISSGSIFVSHLVVPSFIRDQWTLDSQFSELIFSIINFFIYRWQPIVSNSVRGSLPSTSCSSVSIL